MLHSMLKSIAEKVFSVQNLRTIFEYILFSPFVFGDEIKKLKYYEIVINEIISGFVRVEEDIFLKMQQEINKILKNENLSKNIYNLDINEYFADIKKFLHHKEKALRILLEIIRVRRESIEELNLEIPTSSKLVLPHLPSIIYKKLIFDEIEIETEFDLKHEEISKIISSPLSYIDNKKILQLKNEVELTINTWKYLTEIKEIINEYEKTVLKFETSDYKSIPELFREIENFKYKIKTLIEKVSTVSLDNEKNEFILFGNDDASVEVLADYITEEFKNYETGWLFWDISVRGIESSSFYLVAAPSNHGKTMFLINLARQIIENNIDKFGEDDAILFVTLEDNKLKLTRRILSVFGNYAFEHVKRLYDNIAALSYFIDEYYPELKQTHKNEVKRLLKKIKDDAIKNVTKGKVNFVIRDVTGRQNEYSVADLIKDIEFLKNYYGLNVKFVIIDYLNLMRSSYRYDNEYVEHGQIITELKSVSKMYSIPIVSATQLSRAAEGIPELSNTVIGDSYKKIQYADYVFMLRKSDVHKNNDSSAEEKTNTKRKKRETRKTIVDFFTDTGLEIALSSIYDISNKITDVLAEIGASYFNLDNLQRKISKLRRSCANLTSIASHDLSDDEEFDITETENILNNTDVEDYRKENINHAYRNKTDFEILSDVLSLNEYAFTKKKDSSNFVNVYSYLTEVLDRKQVEGKYDNIFVDISSKILRCCNVSISANRLVDDYAKKYFIFNKLNNRYYDIIDIPSIVNDINMTIENFKFLNDYIKNLTAFKKLREVIK